MEDAGTESKTTTFSLDAALLKARNAVKEELFNEKELVHVPHLRKLKQARVEEWGKPLRASIHSQLDDYRRGLGLLSDGARLIEEIKQDFESAFDKCRQVRKHLLGESEYKEVKRVNTVRNNLKTTISFMHRFNDIPKMAKHLLSLLQVKGEEPPKIKFIYLKFRKLVRLKNHILTFHRPDSVDEQHLARELAEAFASLDELARELVFCMWDILGEFLLEDTFISPGPDRTSLLHVLEIVEMEDRARLKTILFSKDSISAATAERPPKARSMKEKAFEELEHGIHERFHNVFIPKEQKEREQHQLLLRPSTTTSTPPAVTRASTLSKSDAPPSEAFEDEFLDLGSHVRGPEPERSPSPATVTALAADEEDWDAYLGGRAESESLESPLHSLSRSSSGWDAFVRPKEDSPVNVEEEPPEEGDAKEAENEETKEPESKEASEPEERAEPVVVAPEPVAVVALQRKRREEREQQVEIVLDKMTNTLEDMWRLQRHFVDCFPPSWDIFKFFQARYNKYLGAHLRQEVVDLSAASHTTLLRTAAWVQEYRRTFFELRGERLQLDDGLWLTEDSLLSHFAQHQRTKVDDMVLNIVQQVFTGSLGPRRTQALLHTAGPVSLFEILTSSLNLVHSSFKLRGHALFIVVEMCAEVYAVYREQIVSRLRRAQPSSAELTLDGAPLPEELLLALINDGARLEEYSEQLCEGLDEVLDVPWETDPEVPSLTEETERLFDDANDAYIHVREQAVSTLVEYIVAVVKAGIAQLFRAKWTKEAGTVLDGEDNKVKACTLIRQVTHTLHDFFQDYSKALQSRAFFGILVGETMAKVGAVYRARKRAGKPSNNPRVVQQLEADQRELVKCFAKYVQPDSGLRPQPHELKEFEEVITAGRKTE